MEKGIWLHNSLISSIHCNTEVCYRESGAVRESFLEMAPDLSPQKIRNPQSEGVGECSTFVVMGSCSGMSRDRVEKQYELQEATRLMELEKGAEFYKLSYLQY